MNSWYCSLHDCLNEMSTRTQTDATEDPKLFQLIRQVSARVDGLFKSKRPFFLPYLEDDKFRVTSDRVNSFDNTFWFRRNLLALNLVTLGTEALTVGSAVEAWPTGITPYKYLRLMDYTRFWYDYCLSSTPQPLLVTILGIWGYNGDYANAWLTVTTLTADPLTGAAITVTDIDGTDGYGRTPWISPGSLLRIGSEFLLVTAVNTATNVATVKRGVNGSTGVGHAIGTAVEVWQVEDVVRRVVARQSAFLYARRGAYESTSITDAGVVNYPSDLLAELRAGLGVFSYE